MHKRRAQYGSRKGIATMVAAIIGIGILVTAIGAFFLMNQVFAHTYQVTISAVAEHNREIAAEQMRIYGSVFDNPNNTLKVTVENTGGIPFTVIALFITERSNGTLTTYTESNLPPVTSCPAPCLPRTINPGTSSPGAVGFQTNITGGDFLMKVLTKRGNVAAGVYESPKAEGPGGNVTESEFAIGYGPARLNFRSFRFIYANATTHDGVDQTGAKVGLTLDGLTIPGYPAYTLPVKSRIILAGNYTNMDNDGRDLVVSSMSRITTGASPSMVARLDFYVIKDFNLDTRLLTPLLLGENISLSYMIPTRVYFAVTSPGGSALQVTPQLTGQWFPGAFITTSGKFSNGAPYGQTLPFAAANLVDYSLLLNRYKGNAGTTFTILSSSQFKSNPFATNIQAGILFSNGTIRALTCTTSCTENAAGTLDGTFRIPAGLMPGFYAIYVTDGVINTVWITFEVVNYLNESLFVNNFDNTYLGWNRTGASPYLNDDISNNIHTKTDGNRSGIFSFSDHTASGTLKNVSLMLEMNGSLSRNDYVDVYLDVGSGFSKIISQKMTSSSYTWYSFNVTATIDSWSKVDVARVYFVFNRQGSPSTEFIYVQRAYINATYTP